MVRTRPSHRDGKRARVLDPAAIPHRISVLVTGIGGVAGLIGALLLTWGVRFLPIPPDFPKPYISAVTVLVALGVILLTGVVVGVTSAIRASRITPVEALRYE